MKSIFANKKNIITIVLSLTIILFVTIFSLILSNSAKTQSPNIQDTNTMYQGDSGIIITDNKLQTVMTGDITKASVFMVGFADEWSDVKEIIDVNQIIELYYNDVTNLDQSLYNSFFSLTYKISIDQSCSLIAMLIAFNLISDINKEIDFGYTSSVKLTKDLNMLKDLYEISTSKYGNAYNKDSNPNAILGTYSSTISGIITDYFKSKNIDIDSTSFSFNLDATTKISDNMKLPPCILGFKNFLLDDSDDVIEAAHSVACLGYNAYTITYTKGIFNKKEERNYYIYVVCDGFNVSDSGEFGDNFQYLIFRDNAEANLHTINDWFNYYN